MNAQIPYRVQKKVLKTPGKPLEKLFNKGAVEGDC